MNATETVIEIIKELSGKESVAEKDRLQDDIGLDSLGLVTLLVVLEEELEMQLEESDMNPFDLATVADVCALAERYGAE